MALSTFRPSDVSSCVKTIGLSDAADRPPWREPTPASPRLAKPKLLEAVRTSSISSSSTSSPISSRLYAPSPWIITSFLIPHVNADFEVVKEISSAPRPGEASGARFHGPRVFVSAAIRPQRSPRPVVADVRCHHAALLSPGFADAPRLAGAVGRDEQKHHRRRPLDGRRAVEVNRWHPPSLVEAASMFPRKKATFFEGGRLRRRRGRHPPQPMRDRRPRGRTLLAGIPSSEDSRVATYRRGERRRSTSRRPGPQAFARHGWFSRRLAGPSVVLRSERGFKNFFERPPKNVDTRSEKRRVPRADRAAAIRETKNGRPSKGPPMKFDGRTGAENDPATGAD